MLGIGRTGHIGFNEPGSGPASRTRLITLDHVTRTDAASDFYGEENVPRRAITMGVGTILEARQIVLMAWGEGKAAVVKRMVEGEVTDTVPATYLQRHPAVQVVLDEAAGAELTPRKTPWLLGLPCNWDDAALVRKAVIWLARTVEKAHPEADGGRLQRKRPLGAAGAVGPGLRHQHPGFQRAAAHHHRLARRQARTPTTPTAPSAPSPFPSACSSSRRTPTTT